MANIFREPLVMLYTSPPFFVFRIYFFKLVEHARG